MKIRNVSRAVCMDLERWMKVRDQDKQQHDKLVALANELRNTFPHLRGVKMRQLVPMIEKHGAAKLAEIAAKHLSPFLFQQAVQKLEV